MARVIIFHNFTCDLNETMFYLSLSLPRPDANLTGKSLELNSNYPYPLDKGVGA